MTQVQRLRDYLRRNPGASSLEITLALSIVNVTGRVSDLRTLPGVVVDCRRRPDGRDGYWLVEAHPPQPEGTEQLTWTGS